ncbi:RecQ family ATP-dependent DNA helicase [Croceivirga thetidis]|uniref:ATP-dependent DNA helicase RecQ n=1 Tax=Croceivirga thetidis TaxID=2721623 RepID=A0ABX1GR50_9FLAO|nr:RecQ family ATP-dependent DNA helicase [Croceivirga thetidis]NKI32059.1 RecQ family ATP-dependent DNA helicase [Croceivirga thetidis]
MHKKPIEIAEKYWGINEFRGSQEAIINTVLNRKNVLALMPTGGGKSICFQIPALINEGICIVVSPLIALIQDQVNALKSKGIKALALIGGINHQEVIELLDNCVYGNYKFLYLSPERLQQEMVLERIREMNVNLIAIDEVHCISQWGHDFRPAYLKCVSLKNVAPNTPFISLTATATKKVVNDILSTLLLDEVTFFKDSFNRKNISYQIDNTEDKYFALKNRLSTDEGSAIVYVRNRRTTVSLVKYLKANGFGADYYHGGLSQDEKKEKLTNWTLEKFKIMVSTNAFGMGIDKSNVRTVIHYQLPENIENYFQEAGRAGRDGHLANAILITNKADKINAENQFINTLPTIEFVKKVYKKLNSHFQIAYGEGFNETFNLNFRDFCEKYGFKKNKTFEVLRILDVNGILSFSQRFREKTTILFTANKGELLDYYVKNAQSKKLVQTILRTYGGVFDFETRIDLNLISKKTGLQTKKIKEEIKHLEKKNFLEFNVADEDLELTFLVQREDELSINPVAKKLAHRNKIKRQNFNTVIRYIDNLKKCRSKFLLNYFDETQAENCGICDICKKNNSSSFNRDDIKFELLNELKSRNLSSRELTRILPYDKMELLTALKELLDDGRIKIDAINRYAKV